MRQKDGRINNPQTRTAMIDESEYRLPRQQDTEPTPTEEERRQAKETLEELNKLPWRPHGEEW